MAADVEAGLPALAAGSLQLQPEPIINCDDEVVFRESCVEDIPHLKQLHLHLFPVRYNDAFFDRLYTRGNFTLVGCSAVTGDIVAVASARCVDDTEQPLPDNTSYIMTLGVQEDYRRRHIGSRAVQQILRVLSTHTTCRVAELHVKSDNHAAVSFYNRLGFQPDPHVGYVRDHYLIEGQRYDAWLLQYDLDALRAANGPASSSSYLSSFRNALSNCRLL
mmetsp:Transcript_57044/g.130966  ORF Transcript_57044/g.130966 Transcript_57044/m.130966 type:complete len:219 (-) Transcript_57044:886-1542(-)|eukprot:CAMPEP_0119362874 /NCGR_PEP_ID=MMETSP1334-20130426/9783_1 /TAXON_ID=127549 /ORGANISM="Calcidiscus leptoporus, Strain RCC1130" /LENGTH=218 /DNA_ID=CAMNT_0007378139 /DNA_START=189 /DNA_END=845 /DNA_ORIENTATION=-